MVINMKNEVKIDLRRRPVIDWLLTRWLALCYYAALEMLQINTMSSSLKDLASISGELDFSRGKPMLQIEIIKLKIVELLPETFFILPAFPNDLDLTPEDFLEMYIDHQQLAIKKVKELIKQLKVE